MVSGETGLDPAPHAFLLLPDIGGDVFGVMGTEENIQQCSPYIEKKYTMLTIHREKKSKNNIPSK